MIKTNDLTRIYKSGLGEIVALSSVSIAIKQGEFVSITGKSGSGKSTLLYQLGLLDHPTRGTVEIDGVEITALSNEKRTYVRLTELGYVFQDYAILPSLTALENVTLPLLMRGESEKSAEKLAITAMEKIGLGDRINNLPSQLSGGEQQRVAIARAIAHNPKIIFADEPTANLDSETSKSVLQVFLDLHKEGQTIVMVTHEEEYAQLTDRILMLADGKLVGEKYPKK